MPEERTATVQLEREARDIIANSRGQGSSDEIASIIQREIALTLEHLQQARAVHAAQRQSMLRVECYIDTEILQRSPAPPFFYDNKVDERDMLRGRLVRIEEERRRTASEHLQRTQFLHERLLQLLNRYRQLAGSDGG